MKVLEDNEECVKGNEEDVRGNEEGIRGSWTLDIGTKVWLISFLTRALY